MNHVSRETQDVARLARFYEEASSCGGFLVFLASSSQ